MYCVFTYCTCTCTKPVFKKQSLSYVRDREIDDRNRKTEKKGEWREMEEVYILSDCYYNICIVDHIP